MHPEGAPVLLGDEAAKLAVHAALGLLHALLGLSHAAAELGHAVTLALTQGIQRV